MDGFYDFNIPTKTGAINARIKLITNDKNLSGYIEFMGKKSAFSGGKVEGNKCYISGRISAVFMRIVYNIEAELVNDILYIDAKTSKGNFKVQGKKVK